MQNEFPFDNNNIKTVGTVILNYFVLLLAPDIQLKYFIYSLSFLSQFQFLQIISTLS